MVFVALSTSNRRQWLQRCRKQMNESYDSQLTVWKQWQLVLVSQLWVLVSQLCLTLCDPMDSSLPGSSWHGILQARILEWVAISFSRGFSQHRDWTPAFCIVHSLPSDLQGSPEKNDMGNSIGSQSSLWVESHLAKDIPSLSTANNKTFLTDMNLEIYLCYKQED